MEMRSDRFRRFFNCPNTVARSILASTSPLSKGKSGAMTARSIMSIPQRKFSNFITISTAVSTFESDRGRHEQGSGRRLKAIQQSTITNIVVPRVWRYDPGYMWTRKVSIGFSVQRKPDKSEAHEILCTLLDLCSLQV